MKIIVFHFIVNSKNYPEASGPKASKLAGAISRAAPIAKRAKVTLYLATPAFSISELSANYPGIPILAQHLDPVSAGSTTGYLVPEIAKLSGAKGSLINHSEHRLEEQDIETNVSALRRLGMKSVVCAKDSLEVGKFAFFYPDFIAIEPPELIGTGTAVSKARPELITESKMALENAIGEKPATVLLCGAGIVDDIDVKRAKELGAQGILVASGVVRAADWFDKIKSLTQGFSM